MASDQLDRLNHLLAMVWERNAFYTEKWRGVGEAFSRLHALEELRRFPLTTRNELVADQLLQPPLGRNLTFALPSYKRILRSSGTTRAPLFWADDPASWDWVLRCSEQLFHLAGLNGSDRVFLALSLEASTGPWSIYEGAQRLGCATLVAHGMDLEQQLDALVEFGTSTLLGKPTRLLALAQTGRARGLDLQELGLTRLICAGEPCAMTLRQELEDHWGARCFDRYGMTETGPIAAECPAHPGGMHLLSNELVAEVLTPSGDRHVRVGQAGELVLTTLGRIGRPVIRYRTGDLVRLGPKRQCACGSSDPLLIGGVCRISAALGEDRGRPAGRRVNRRLNSCRR